MITAVALPSILADLVTANGTSAWIELRKASWIINGYLLVYILMMPLAGRLADLWGARRLFIAALGIFTVGSVVAGMAQDLDQLIAGRVVQAVGGGVLVPVGTAAAAHLYDGHGSSAGPRCHRGSHVPGHGRRTVPRRRDPVRDPSGLGARRRRLGRLGGRRRPGPRVAVDLLRQRPDRHRRHAPRLGGVAGVGDATPQRPHRPRRCRRLRACARVRARGTDADRRDAGPRSIPRADRGDGDPCDDRVRRDRPDHRAGAAQFGSVPGCPPLRRRRVQRGGSGVVAHRLCVRDRDHRWGGLRRSGPVRRPGRAASCPRGAGRRDRARCPAIRLRGPCRELPRRDAGRASRRRRRPPRDVALDAGDLDRRCGTWLLRRSASGSGCR